ncbi:MAG: hypothetical protein K2N90_06090 [Lachnospiraceae bacterium]|nr:hypothetical protein [Lachnospiraceae bacterium]
MQIRMFTENRFHAVIGSAPQMKNQSAQVSGGVFNGAQCKVTISGEGRKLSEQAKTQTVKSAQSLKAEKAMLRQQEQSEQADETQNEYLDLLEEINNTIKSMNNSYQAGADKETIEKKQQVLRAMREQKQRQQEENQRKAKEAQQMAMQSSGAQEEIDKNNRDLLVMLKSIKESEKSEEDEIRKGGKVEEGGSNGVQTENSVSDIIQNAATQFTVSSAKREMDVVGMIDTLNEEGHNYLAKADEIVRNALEEAEDLKKYVLDGNCTDDEKEEAILRYREKMMGAYGDLATYRRRGLQMIRDSKECKIEHIKDNPLQGMEETKKSMINSAVDAAINEASQGKIEETSQELEDAVEELIDERNDVDHVDSDETEKTKEEETEAIGDKLNASDQE